MASNISRIGSGLNQTPKSSPISRSSPPHSPVKASNIELKLTLKRVIGTTARSSSSFDYLSSTKCIAYTAGATVVLATIDDEQNVSQRFFHARPGLQTSKTATPLHELTSPLSASHTPRPRPANRGRDGANNNSYFALPTKETSDSPSIRKNSLRERIKATTCVSLSPDGRLLAVGETGHKPRVLIFSTAVDSSMETPLTVLSEHSFGVRCIAFSPDSQYLATLGELNDGFLHVWRVNSRTGNTNLYASNKCTSNIRNLIWVGNSLITLGTRHVKIWRIGISVEDMSQNKPGDTSFSDGVKTLAGRNCLLGPLLDQIFTSAVSISAEKAIVCSEQGDICLLVDNDVSPQFFKVAQTGFNVNAVIAESGNHLIVGGSSCMVFALEDFINIATNSTSLVLVEGTSLVLCKQPNQVSAMALVGRNLIFLDTHMNMTMVDISKQELCGALKPSKTKLDAHGAAVPGVQDAPIGNTLGADFFTWSADGLVLFWDCDGKCIQSVRIIMDDSNDGAEYVNELRVVRLCRSGKYVISGDRSGRLKLTDTADGSVLHDDKAHMGEITDITTHEEENRNLIITCGRDRVIQVYRWRSAQLALVQTLDEHVGSVHRILFNNDHTKLLSCSYDRNVVVWDVVRGDGESSSVVALLKARTIVLKSTPLSLVLSSTQMDTFLVSTNDKQIAKYDIRQGNLLSRFKLLDADGEDSISMSAITHFPWDKYDCVIAGISNTDKSVRIYDEGARLLACQCGHTEGLTGIVMIQNPRTPERKSLITTGADGTVFIWELCSNAAHVHKDLEAHNPERAIESNGAVTPPCKTPLRRVLSSSEIARLQDIRAAQGTSDNNGVRTSERPGHNRRPSKLSNSHTPDGKSTTPKQYLDTPTRSIAQSHQRQSTLRRSTTGGSMSSTEQPVVGCSSLPTTSETQSGSSVKKSLNTTSPNIELNALILATDQVCRKLCNYRKILSASHEVLPSQHAQDLEQELSLTAKVIVEKAARSEAAMTKLLDEYSGRLVELLDEKIEASVARQIGRKTQHSS